MNIKKKILGITIAPVIILGLISMFLTTTMVRSAMLEEIEEALRGTAAATLAAYDQNTGDYLQTSNGDIWKGSYNISKSESLVDRIKGNTGMDVTFFYGDTRIMTSAVDAGGNRILNSKAGDRIVEKVLQGGESYFSHAVSIEGTLNYGYFIPVYQNGSTDEIIGMIFVGTDKQEKDAVINKILGTISMAVCAVMILCIAIAMKLATSMSRNIRSSIEVVGKVADGDLNVWVEDKLLGRHDEIGDLSRVTITLRDAMKATIQEISQNAKHLLDASELLGTAADQTNGTMDHVRMAVNQIVENSTEQAQNSQNTSEHMRIMGENITETSAEVELLDDNAASMQQSSEKAAETLNNLRNINVEVERIIGEVQEQTNRTNDSVQKIHEATAFITSIAEETNLLSLNASIEAARAGEAGKGFAVVAGQIQDLSMGTKTSSGRIRDALDHLEETSEKMTESITKTLEMIRMTREKLTQVQESVTSITDDSKKLGQNIGVIDGAMKEVEASNSDMVENMKQICDTMEVMTECINQSDEASRTMLSKYEESSVNVDKIESVVGKLMEELGSGGFMGIGDAQPGMRVVLVAKNGAQAAGTEFHGEVFESQSDGVLVKIKPEAGKTIEIKKKDITYELQICVNNALYTWEDVSVSAASNAGANSYRIAVATNPKVINRRKYPRMPVANACTVTLKKSGKAYNGRMINISAGGFAFSAHQEDFANAIGQDILLEIPDFPLEEARTLDGHIIRSTDNDGEFIVGCRMPEDSEEIQAYVNKNYRE